MTDRFDTLERLGRLRDQGLLTDDEFAREKAQLLAGKEASSAAELSDAATPASTEPAGSHIGQPNQASPDAAAPFVEAPENTVADDLTSTLRPINGVPDASRQVRRVWATGALLVAGEFVSEVGRVNQSLAGRSWTSTVSMGDELLTSAVSLSVSTVVVGLLSLWIAHRASRVGVVILAVLTVSAVLWPFITPEPMKLAAKLGSGGLAALALWYLIGVARGAFWLAGRQPIGGNPARAEAANWKDAWARGRATSAPIRKIIGWIALGWLGLFLIGGAWFWWSTHSDGPTPPQPAVMTSPASASSYPPPPSAVTAAPALTPTGQMLIGVWSPDPGICAGWGTYELREDGQVITEGALGSWWIAQSQLVLQMRSYGMDTDFPGPIEDHGGFVEVLGQDEIRLTRASEVETYYRCSNAP